MAHVYILYSKNLERYYIGSCLNLENRLKAHKSKQFPDCFTAKDDSWHLFFEIPELEYKQARSIEQHIKNMKSSVYILHLSRYPEMTEKLKKRYM
jgi:putative endonuclease